MADLLELLNEVSSEQPCGSYLEYDPGYLELGKSILGKPEDPITGEKAQPPSWRDVQKGALALLERSKDLQITLYLLRALIHLEGVQGFRDGLSLLSGLIEKYWESIHPVLDPEDDFDPTARINILEELANFESVLRPLSLAPLVDSKAAGRFSLRDFHLATDKLELPDGASKPDISIIKAAFLDVSADTLSATYQAITDSETLVRQIEGFVAEQVGVSNGPDLAALTALLKDMRSLFSQLGGNVWAQEGGDSPEGDQAEQASSEESASSGLKPATPGGVQSRQDVLLTLDRICKYYAENEPSSPVPILLQRAKMLVTADFMQIVQNLMPDAVSQLELIKGPDPDAD